MKKGITVYHVEKLYGKNDEIRYVVFPYSLRGTLQIYFGIDLRYHFWKTQYYPWHLRFTSFIKWASATRLSSESAEKLARKMRNKEKSRL